MKTERTKANHLIWFQPFTLQCCCVTTFRNCFVLEKLSLHSKFRPSDFSNNYIGNQYIGLHFRSVYICLNQSFILNVCSKKMGKYAAGKW